MSRLRKVSPFSFFSFFYFAAGIGLVIALFQSSSVPVHVGLLGVLSLVVSYGLNRMKRWALFLTVLTALLGVPFGSVTIYAIYRVFGLGLSEIPLLSMMILHLALSVTSLFYVIARRDRFG